MKKTTLTNTFAAMIAFAGVTGLQAQPATEFVPFNSFLRATEDVNSTVLNRADSKAKDAKTLEQMRRHILSMYQGVDVKHSFVTDSGTFDCVRADQQPSLRLSGKTSIAALPPDSMLTRNSAQSNGTGEGLTHPALAANANSVDQFGNATSCEADTIPMKRITLDDMVKFGSLQEFFEKGPDGTGRPVAAKPEADPASPSDGHKYAYMYQNVENIGGGSNLNVWNPLVDVNHGELMSLSQEWYIGGSGSTTQTAEVGWQVQPLRWGTYSSVLFVYWTADDYSKTGCYNLTCPGFVQVSNRVAFGAPLGFTSTLGGDQYDISAQYMLYQGNWWLAIDGIWIGYIDGSSYRGGQMSRNAQMIEYGTESAGNNSLWPAEGSGQWATAGFGYAAYQRNMFYTDLSGNGYYASLTHANPSPSCYNTAGPYNDDNPDWQVFFYAGGPGGATCQ